MQALSVFEDLTGKSPNPAKAAPLGISSSWCSAFKCPCNLQRFHLLGKVVSANEKATKEFPSDTKVI